MNNMNTAQKIVAFAAHAVKEGQKCRITWPVVAVGVDPECKNIFGNDYVGTRFSDGSAISVSPKRDNMPLEFVGTFAEEVENA